VSTTKIKPYRPQRKTRDLLASVQAVLDSYDGQMTVRQVFYQLVAHYGYPNAERNYKRLPQQIQHLLAHLPPLAPIPQRRCQALRHTRLPIHLRQHHAPPSELTRPPSNRPTIWRPPRNPKLRGELHCVIVGDTSWNRSLCVTEPSRRFSDLPLWTSHE